jgi:hypothetical protein
MTKRELKRRLDGVFEDLTNTERVEAFIEAAGAGENDIVDKLTRTAPVHEYIMTDAAYRDGTREVLFLSELARRDLVRRYRTIRVHELTRDRAVALVCLNEALGRLSRGQFSVDATGSMQTPQSWANDYDDTYEPDQGRLATKYRELWDGSALEFCFAEDTGPGEYFPGLAASASLAYRTESGDASAGSPPFFHGEAFVSEVRLLWALARFAETFHMWRLFAEEHLELELDMLLSVTQPVEDPEEVWTPASIEEAACRAVLSSMSGYLDAFEAVRERVAAHYDGEVDPYPGPEAVAEEQAAELAETIEVPLT